jgi:hypothetical protein
LTAKGLHPALVELLAKITTNATGLANLKTAFEGRRQITVASLYLGG